MNSFILILFVLFSASCNNTNPIPNPEPELIPIEPIPTETVTPSPSPEPTETPSPEPTSSPTPSPLPTNYSGPIEFKIYVDKFVADGLIQGNRVDMVNPITTIRFGNLSNYGSSVIGLCESTRTWRRVTINPTFWNRVSEASRELLMHHELGHCNLFRRHRTDLLSTGKYASIMYPTIMTSSTYLDNYDYYQEELFTWNALDDGRPRIHICE